MSNFLKLFSSLIHILKKKDEIKTSNVKKKTPKKPPNKQISVLIKIP